MPCNSIEKLCIIGAALALAGLCVSGCGQYTRVRVVRLGQVENDPRSPVGSIRAELESLTEELARESRDAQTKGAPAERQVRIARTERLESIQSRVQIPQELRTDPLSIHQMRALADEVAEIAESSSSNHVKQAQALAARARQLEERTNSSGFIEQGDFIINPADPVLNSARDPGPYPTNPTVVFSEAVTSAVGDTGLLLVQESPASFRVLSLAADPTEVLKNTLVAMNQVLQIVATLGPLVGVPVPKFQLPLPAQGTGATQGPSGNGKADASTDLLTQVTMSKALAADTEYASLAGDIRTAQNNNDRLKQAAALLRLLEVHQFIAAEETGPPPDAPAPVRIDPSIEIQVVPQ